ncbi:MAG: indolepyruvate oxidoreductase subunit beta [Spirochaetales bacterium]|nr:indolepyruvate oxidoreductase subunit beta [Spirochaetales bacterium]
MVKNILLVGVGGQGTLLASKLLTTGLMEAGYDVKMNEIHGMSQRGGSVSSHVRYGEKVFSPVIDRGAADILVSFEEMEALRWLEYLKPEGKVVVNKFRSNPVSMLTGDTKYPENILDLITSKADAIILDACQIAEKLGNSRVMNIVLLGALIEVIGINSIDWEGLIEKHVKYDFVDINIKAFKAGRNQV